MRFAGFIGPSYTAQSLNVDAQRCVNLFPEINPLGTGKEREIASLVPTPGLLKLLTLPASPVRGLWRASDDTFYAVGGNKFYKISSSWVATEKGTLNTETGAVSIADNGLHVVVVDGLDGYAYTIATDSFAEITDVDFQPADQVTFQDGYFLFNKKDSGQFFFSDLNSVNFDALDIATAEVSPDNLVGLISSNQNLHLFGTQSTEIFYNSGDADSPWQRIQGAVSDVGCSAAHSIARLLSQVYWVGGDKDGQGIVYRMNGYQAERVSTPSIEQVIRSIPVSDLANARAWTYQQGGHGFYCLNLPGIDSTWVFDSSTQLWHERSYRNLWSDERHRADCHALAFGKNVVGDYETGEIYELSQTTYTDDGDEIVRIRQAPHLTSGLKRLFHKSIQIDMEMGVGLNGEGQGVDPKVMLDWSDDGGHSFKDEILLSIGKIGQKTVRAIARRLGSSRDRVYRVKVSDPVKVVFIGAEIDVEEGLS